MTDSTEDTPTLPVASIGSRCGGSERSRHEQSTASHARSLRGALLDLLGDEASMAPRTRKLYAKLLALKKRFTEEAAQ